MHQVCLTFIVEKLLGEGNLISFHISFGDVEMSWISNEITQTHDTFQTIVVWYRVSSPCLARCQENKGRFEGLTKKRISEQTVVENL